MNREISPGESGLRIETITKTYGKNTVLDHLELDVKRGKLVSLLGPSGCGKSTTLNLISGFDSPDSGRVKLDGEDITRLPPNKRDTAIVFQNYALFPHMSVEKNVNYGLKVRHFDKGVAADRVHTVLDLLGIANLKGRYPGELSGGQQQRVALARALAVRPSLLLLDEPLSNLDAKLRKDIRLEIRKLQKELDQTAVFVTHDQEEALMISDYIAILNKGRLEQYGTPADLWASPKTVYVADFMGVENILSLDDEGRGVSSGRSSILSGSAVAESVRGYSHLGFRPSSASLHSLDSEVPDNALAIRASIVAKAYLGTHFRYSCEVPDRTGLELGVEQSVGDPQFDPGQQVVVVVRPSELLPLDDSDNDRRSVAGNAEVVSEAAR